jgi:hypothetical protein
MKTDPGYDLDISPSAEAAAMRELDRLRTPLLDEQETVLAAIVAAPTPDVRPPWRRSGWR